MLSCFHLISACDGWTDGRTDRIAISLTRNKNITLAETSFGQTSLNQFKPMLAELANHSHGLSMTIMVNANYGK